MVSNEAPKIQKISNVVLVVGIALSILATITVTILFYENSRSNEVHHHHYECIQAANTLMEASDYLTSEVRMYVMTERRDYAENYLREVFVDRRRDKALEVLANDESHRKALDALTAAFEESSALSETELYAMNLMASANGMEHVPTAVSEKYLSTEDSLLTSEQKRERAKELVLGEEYQKSKDTIIENVTACTERLLSELSQEESSIEAKRTALIVLLTIIVLLFVLLLSHIVYANMVLIVRPIHGHVESIKRDESLKVKGALELCHMAEAYNKMFELNHRKTEMLEHEAHTDALTGLYNRGAYDHLFETNQNDIVLILIDVDNFKTVNDTFGHTAGDETLKRVAKAIVGQFRTTDYACRIGGDEFAVIMTQMKGVGHPIVEHKLANVASELQGMPDGTPTVTLSMGIAFSCELEDGKNIYRAADHALYRAKEQGRNRICFYESE